MLEFLIKWLVFKYYQCFPKHYFSWRPIPGTKTYWVNIAKETWGEVQTKEVIKKKYRWFGEQRTEKVAVYDVDCVLIYAANQDNADRKAKERIKQFKYLFDGSNSSDNR